MMDKKELNVMELETIAGGNWLDSLLEFAEEVIPALGEYIDYLPIPK